MGLPPLRALGLVHPAGACLSDALLHRLSTSAFAGAPSGFPFAWEENEGCWECLVAWCGANGASIPAWFHHGLVALSAQRFPRGHWPAVVASWASDYAPLVAEGTRDGASAERAARLASELEAVRTYAAQHRTHVLVLGSAMDATCSSTKMRDELTPAIGGDFRLLPNEAGGHMSLGDEANAHIYEVAGPALGRWLVEVGLAATGAAVAC